MVFVVVCLFVVRCKKAVSINQRNQAWTQMREDRNGVPVEKLALSLSMSEHVNIPLNGVSNVVHSHTFAKQRS